MKHLTTIEYRSHTNAKIENYKKTIIARLRDYVAEHQDNPDIFVYLLKYAYYTKVHRSADVFQFPVVLSGQPPGATLFDFRQWYIWDYSVMYHIHIAETFITRVQMRESFVIWLTAVQKRFKYDYDKCVQETPVFNTSELVLVDRPALAANTKNLKTNDKPM